MRARKAAVLIALGGALLLLFGCGGGPSESDYVEACVAKPEANEAECRCVAHEAKGTFSEKAWEAFVLDEQDKSEESNAILAKLSIKEQSEFIGAAIDVTRKCASSG